MSADPFGRRMRHDVDAPFDRAEQVTAGPERVVGDYGDVVLTRQFDDRFEVGHVELRVADGFQIDRLRSRIDQRSDAPYVVAVGEPYLDTETAQGDFELIVRAAVDVRGADDVVAGFGEVADGQKLRRQARCGRYGRRAAFERRNAVFEYGRRRIGQSRVDVAELLQSEPVGAFLRVRKDIRRGLVNGNGARTGRGVGRLSCVNLQGVEVIISFAHGFIFLIGL